MMGGAIDRKNFLNFVHRLDSEELQSVPFEFETCHLGFVVISVREEVGQKPSPLPAKNIRSLLTKDRQSLASKKANTNQTGTLSPPSALFQRERKVLRHGSHAGSPSTDSPGWSARVRLFDPMQRHV
jgi:hypothetical protein